ncbi:MAG TPA: dTDP-4-dehydrorhamnose 3,5-epimerase [Longimicrobiales bacterium]|nr:dTDP-4-dehydrorhamnose 3,5-epimerase [Longimicrobiales bacterium]
MGSELKIVDTPLAGVVVVELDRFDDARGWFMEAWNEERYRAAGLSLNFAQNNVSYSRRGVLRGMHFQSPNAQGKLVCVLSGVVFDAVVDVRLGSPTWGQWYGCEISVENRRQIWVPEGFAHGFLVMSEDAVVHYSCTSPYHAGSDRTLAWDDPVVGINWPRKPEAMSPKDANAPGLRELSSRELPIFHERRRTE